MKSKAFYHIIFALSTIKGMKKINKNLHILHSKKKVNQEKIEKIHQELKTIVEKIENNLNQKNNQNDTSRPSNETRITST